MAKVSVIICTKNRIYALKQAIETVLNSNYRDFEIIVVEGVSNDGTHSMCLKLFEDDIIKYVYNGAKSRIDARNAGWKVASGEYVCFLDDDDTQVNNRLFEQVNFLDENPDVSVVSCTTVFNQSTGLVHSLSNLNHKQIAGLVKEKEIDNVINFQSCMFRKADVEQYLHGRPPFREEFIGGGEGQVLLYELLWNAGLKFANISSTLYVYQVGVAKNSLTARVEPKFYNDNLWEKSYEDRKTFINNIDEYTFEKMRERFMKENNITDLEPDNNENFLMQIQDNVTLEIIDRNEQMKKAYEDQLFEVTQRPTHAPEFITTTSNLIKDKKENGKKTKAELSEIFVKLPKAPQEFVDKVKKNKGNKTQVVLDEINSTEIPTEKPKRSRKKKEEAPTEAPKKRGRKKKEEESK